MFKLNEIKAILNNTPNTLNSLLNNLPDEVINSNEGDKTWSPKEVLGHLICGEKTDWITRAKIILFEGADSTFKPFDMEFQYNYIPNRSITDLLMEFKKLRADNIIELDKLNIKEEDLSKTAKHPSHGSVTMKELLSTWAVHDLGHIAQISRVISKQYKNDTGPWGKYLRILK